MDCPSCKHSLRTIQYEGIDIETCDHCGGDWLDADELSKITVIREVIFDVDERRAIAEAEPIRGVRPQDVDRDLVCPKCGATTDVVNYGGNSGILVDRCTGCGGFWLDASELEKVQMVVEGWEDALPEDLRKYGPKLRDVAVRMDIEDDVRVSRLPIIGGFINMCVNGILDVID